MGADVEDDHGAHHFRGEDSVVEVGDHGGHGEAGFDDGWRGNWGS